jgi:hypothetical protein
MYSLRRRSLQDVGAAETKIGEVTRKQSVAPNRPTDCFAADENNDQYRLILTIHSDTIEMPPTFPPETGIQIYRSYEPLMFTHIGS